MRKFSQITPDEDAQLLLAWYRGDLSAFETLIWKYQRRIFNLALLLTGEQKAACEIAENSFITAYQNIRSLKSTGRFSSWLAATALKECRKRADYPHEVLESPAGPDPDLAEEENNYSAAVHRRLELCIRELPVELSELILLRYVRGYSLDRVEEILQISGDLLLTRLFEAQETLAYWLKSGTENPAELAALKTATNSIHPEIRKNFSAYLDNSTESDEKELTKEHLKSCGSCREALAELEWMVEDIKSIPDVEPPHWLATAILEKVKVSPPEPAIVQDKSDLKITIAMAAVFIAVVGASSYLLQNRSVPQGEPSGSVKQTVSSPAGEQRDESARTDTTSPGQGVLRGNVTTRPGSPETESISRPSVPLPTLLPPGETPQAAPLIKQLLPAVAGQNEQLSKKGKSEPLTPHLEEWGDSPPQSTPPQKKVPLPRVRGGELAVALNSADPVAAAHEIENAVTASGGKVNGRAYSGSTSIIYTSVEVDRFFGLMSRLEKIGRLQELPQLPEEAEGTVDLVIKWK